MASDNHIAIDLGAQSVSAAVFSRGAKDQLILEKFVSEELLADPAADSARLDQTKVSIGQIVKALKIRKQSVRYALSTQSVFTRFVTLPPLEHEQIDQIVGFEAQQQVPFPLEDAVWDYQTLGSEDDIEVEVVLVAIKANELTSINNAVRGNGLETGTVDLAPFALYNAFRYNYPDVDHPVVLIDIGARTTNLIYAESDKVFVRSINVGGREITQAIAKEFDISFQDAEQRKIQDGFVALGGGYADHDDPEIAAMSKVIRNASTRLHSEVVRTNNFYRSNQGGSAPAMAFLCGAGAGLPYLNEFFQEKLKIPVEYFNALRNVKLGKRVDEPTVTHNAHALGELVGLGLRGLGNCPTELDLVPPIVQRERDIAKRAPFLWLAAFSAAIMIAATGYWFQRAADYSAQQANNITSEVEELEEMSGKIDEQVSRLASIKQRSDPYSTAVFDRVYWIETFRTLNDAMVDDMVWFVELQPMASEKTLMGATGELDSAIEPGLQEEALPGKHEIDWIQLKGLWRDNDDLQSRVVYRYLDELRKSKSGRFDIVERNADGSPKVDEEGLIVKKYVDTELLPYLNMGTAGDRHAWPFTLRLPLAEGYKIQYTK